MTYSNCRTCHSPHKPTAIAYVEKIDPLFCSGCHEDIVQLIQAEGGSHKNFITCTDCHIDHGENAIPECTMCHNPNQDNHFGAENCESCHDPHSPQIANRKTGKPLKPLCTACHPQQNKQMQDYPSRHGFVDCIICHTEHREFFTCQKCHKPHEEGTSYEQCLVCHNPHMPTHIKFTDPTAESLCKNCHISEQTLIDTKGAGHKTDVSCIDCHEQHGKAGIPECDVCHGPDDSIHYRVGNCASCHDPHDPLTVKVSAVEEAKPACISCHSQQG
ncbi:MAG: cytochrome c3 family protein, partial [Desulfobulbaceae bacterium]|nr:cytochrome c3 family protein [Desulfobulbaceae bacterium]